MLSMHSLPPRSTKSFSQRYDCNRTSTAAPGAASLTASTRLSGRVTFQTRADTCRTSTGTGGLAESSAALARCTDWLVATYATNPALALAGASPYLRLFGTVAGGWLMAMAALAARRHLSEGAPERDFLTAKLATARFYADNILAEADGLAAQVTRGGESLLAMTAEQF